MVKPIIKWAGGKADEIKHILKYIPSDISIYLEPFVGGGALFFHLQPENAVINDVHKELVAFYRAIKNGNASDIYEFMETHPNEEYTYYTLRGSECITTLDVAKRFYYLRKTCYRGMSRYNKKGQFNICFGRYKNVNYENLLDTEYEEILKRAEIHNESFEYIFEHYNSSNNFMFLDPPYDCDFTDYGFCKFGKDEHRQLAHNFKTTNIRCLMVIGKTTFIEELYDGYIVEEYDKKYRMKIHSGRVNAGATHLVIKNY